VKKKGTKVKVTCNVQLVASASSSRLRWRLTRGGHVYARGTISTSRAAHAELDLGRLSKGHYRLHVQGRHGGTLLVVS
ncbi:MAG TPA: hypothetical protein VHR65_03600, partial [Solirubrobacterales bacterium]|nr:hypothetical protein [Solirubrobacterales bacterium]